jgi:tetratricopeptide (TPR) repeat protein
VSSDRGAAAVGTSGDSDPICVAGAPFSVLDYASAHRHARAIAEAVARRIMPPWLPERGHGEFVNERRLTDEQIALIQQWAAQSAPEGDAADTPHPPAFSGDWQLGTPDLVLQLPQPYVLQPNDRDVFRNFVIPVSVGAARYVRGVEFRADNVRVLHHANLALDPGRIGRRLDRMDAEPGFATMADDEVQNVFGWSPGKVPVLEPADTAWTLEPGADLVLQLHLIAATTPQTVQPTIGLFFSDKPPTRSPIVIKLESKAIDIPAGDANYVVEDHYVLPADVDAVSIYPHAHYLAKEMRGTATLPDGSTQDLIWIRRWDVRWQDQYRYRAPVFLPRGTSLAMRFTYDNSAGNPNNRHRPPQRVAWGPLSTDEMGALWLEVVPRRNEDAGLLIADYYRRALQADIAAGELQVRNRPDDAAAHDSLGLKYLQAGRGQEAQREVEAALRLTPNDAEAHSNLGTILQAQGRLAEALQHLRQAARLKPKDDRIRFNLGNGLYASGDVAQAAREFEAAIALNGDNADAHFNLAMILGPQNRLADAIAHLRRVVEINPRNGEAYRNLSVAYGLQGQLDAAIGAAQQAVRLEPDSPAARDQLNRLLAARGHL